MVQRLLALILTLNASVAYGAAKIQNEDVKSLSQVTAAGGSVLNLINDSKIAVTANGINQTLNAAIASGLIGGGGAGVNLLKDGDFELPALGTYWSTFSTTVSSAANGTPQPTTAPAACTTCSIAISNTTTNPLNGKQSLLVAAASGVTAGHGFISAPFTVAPAYQGQVLTIKGLQSLLTGVPNMSGTSANTYAIYVYDVTNAAWIQPAGTYGIVSTVGPIQPAAFQMPSNTTSARIAIVALNALASPTSSLFDDVSVGPQATVITPNLTDWKQYTMNVGASTTAPTKATTRVDIARYRQVGSDLEIEYVLSWTNNTGAQSGSGIYSFPIPSGYTIDLNQKPVGAAVGWAKILDSTPNNWIGQPVVATNNSFNLSGKYSPYQTAGSVTDATLSATQFGFAITTGYNLYFYAKVPVVGGQSGVQQSSDYDGRATTFVGMKNGNQSVTVNATPISFVTTGDRGGAWTGDTYVVQVAGDYEVAGSLVVSGTATTPAVYLNEVFQGFFTVANGGAGAGAVTIYNAKVNDKITLRANTTTTAVQGNLGIKRIGGAQPIQMQPTIAARYTTAAGQSNASGVSTVVNFATPTYDTSGLVTPGAAWRFTANVPGKYAIKAAVTTANSNFAGGQYPYLSVFKNGTEYSRGSGVWPTSSGGYIIGVNVNDTVSLQTGDYVDIRFFNAASAAVSLSATGVSNYVAIERVAN